MTLALGVATTVAATMSPLTVYGVKLTLDGLTSGQGVWTGIGMTGGALLVSALVASFAGPLGDTLDERILRYVKHDLIRLTAQIPSLDHHEHPVLADKLTLVERDAYHLSGIFRLLSIAGTVTSTVAVITILCPACSRHLGMPGGVFATATGAVEPECVLSAAQ
jgi:ATP-binding cassette subfamily B protein